MNLKCDKSMVLAGMIEARYTDEQEGELRAVAVVIEKPAADGKAAKKLAIVACDVLWIPRPQVDAALAEIEKTTGIPPQNVLINATHTHHAPSTAPAHDFGVSLKFCEELKRGIVRAVQEANQRLAGGDASFFFALGEERTVGANSRLKLADGNITWLNPARGGTERSSDRPLRSPASRLGLSRPGGQDAGFALQSLDPHHRYAKRPQRPLAQLLWTGCPGTGERNRRHGWLSRRGLRLDAQHHAGPVAEAIIRMKRAVKQRGLEATRHPVAELGRSGGR